LTDDAQRTRLRIVGGEETIDAMDLRSFGVRPRTWLTRLTYHRADYVLLGLSALILVASTVVTLSGYGRFWVPPAFLR
jgi:energy-coupling factor transporter transmembrane protein EcfT